MGPRKPLVGRVSLHHGLVAVTGASGRLGRPVMDALAARGIAAIAWSRPDYDLDDPSAAERLMQRDGPAVVIHAAGWVDVDGCAREPDRAMRRNATAAGELAHAAAGAGADLILISTNEVFDGERRDGRGYTEKDEPSPASAYGESKLAGERAAEEAVDGRSRLWVVRTSWLYGPVGNDFPSKIVGAVDRGVRPLRVVDDEYGCPTSTAALAQLLVADLRDLAPPGTYHIAGGDCVSRYAWAASLLATARPGSKVVPISSTEFQRASTPPLWGVLDCTLAAGLRMTIPSWRSIATDS